MPPRKSKVAPRPVLGKGRMRLAIGLVVAIAVMGTASAASILIFTQTVPAGTVPSSGFTSFCPALVLNTTSSGANTTSAEVVYNCGTTPAVSVTKAASYVPTYTLPSAFSSAFLVPSTSGGLPTSSPTTAACSSYTGAIPLISGASASLSTGPYVYCFTSPSPGASITSFTVSWT